MDEKQTKNTTVAGALHTASTRHPFAEAFNLNVRQLEEDGIEMEM